MARRLVYLNKYNNCRVTNNFPPPYMTPYVYPRLGFPRLLLALLSIRLISYVLRVCILLRKARWRQLLKDGIKFFRLAPIPAVRLVSTEGMHRWFFGGSYGIRLVFVFGRSMWIWSSFLCVCASTGWIFLTGALVLWDDFSAVYYNKVCPTRVRDGGAPLARSVIIIIARWAMYMDASFGYF